MLLASVERLGSDITDQELRDCKAALTEIEADEPPPNNAVDYIVHNDECSARGRPQSEMVAINWLQRVTAPYLDLCSDTPKYREDAAEPSKTSE